MKNQNKTIQIQITNIFLMCCLLITCGCTSRINMHTSPKPTITPSPPIKYTATETQISVVDRSESANSEILEPTNTAFPTQETLKFPDWFKNPDIDILVYGSKPDEEGFSTLNFFNANTDEIFQFPTMKTSGFFWTQDGKYFGYLFEDCKNYALIDTFSGTVNIYPNGFDVNRIQFTCGTSFYFYAQHFVPINNENDLSRLKLIPISQKGLMSSDNRFYLSDTYGQAVVIRDLLTGDEFSVTDPNDELYDYTSAWSPNETILGIAQSDKEPGLLLGMDEGAKITMRIFDVEKKTEIASYPNISWPNWSPDGSKLLYQPQGLHYMFFSPLCIFDTIENTNQCIDEMTTWHLEDTDHKKMYSTQWINEEMAAYVYGANGDEPFQIISGLCFLSIEDRKEQCFLEEENKFILNYNLSPSNNFVKVYLDEAPKYTDYNIHPELGVVNLTTGELIDLGSFSDYHDSGDSFTAWRPKLVP